MVFDCEGNSLTPTKFHCLSYQDGDTIKSFTKQKDMALWLLDQERLVGHNIILWDIPQLERVLEIEVKAELVDTLGLSWYLYPSKKVHGLEDWGEHFHVPKPLIADWENLPLEEYVHRCETDVAINVRLLDKQMDYLSRLYETDDPLSLPIVRYLSFKLSCAKDQEDSRWKLDREHCLKTIDVLTPLIEDKREVLASVMPKVDKWRDKHPPAKPFKKDGSLSASGVSWRTLLDERGLPTTHNLPVPVLTDQIAPNPGSPVQRKAWLFSLGWEPETFKEEKDDDGKIRKIPQVKLVNSPDLCPSVIRLIDDYPEVAHLEGLSMMEHRIGLLNGFLRDVDDEGFLKARISGFTNTLRFKHKEIVNVPGSDKPFGEELRACFIARGGYELAGCDMASLESTTKRHYMFPYDPEYVEEMSQPDFDEHLSLAVYNNAITADEERFYNWFLTKSSLKD